MIRRELSGRESRRGLTQVHVVVVVVLAYDGVGLEGLGLGIGRFRRSSGGEFCLVTCSFFLLASSLILFLLLSLWLCLPWTRITPRKARTPPLLMPLMAVNSHP